VSVGRIAIADYDATWPAQFENEAAAVRSVLGPRAFRIDHVGSTSVPSLPAKPIIDILLVVADSSDESSYVPRLEAAGYVLRIREPDWYEHRMFNGPRTPVNLHVFSVRCPEIERMLAFRDWLRQNADDRKTYEDLKRTLAQHDWESVDDYARAKSGVVSQILARAERTIDAELVRALLREQHEDLTGLPLNEGLSGWDNEMFRLGEQLAVRLPRRATAATLTRNEQHWLPQLSARLPLPIPAPIRIGRPSSHFQWPWSVVPWLAGTPALRATVFDQGAITEPLGMFLQSLHRPAPADAPRNPWRGVPLAARTELLHRDVGRLGDEVDRDAVFTLWDRALGAGEWSGPPLWIHGDLHPGNLLVDNGRLSAVVDFGDLTSGDPATDFSVAWMLLSPRHRDRFRAAVRPASNPVDDDTWLRARGWALALGIAYRASSRDDDWLAELGKTTIAAALEGDR
jgi:GrpB-like predicted nucleotidyltransferase (UPF0157 family)/aminoglycoside phosphotransferase (APT) family kinase protein